MYCSDAVLHTNFTTVCVIEAELLAYAHTGFFPVVGKLRVWGQKSPSGGVHG